MPRAMLPVPMIVMSMSSPFRGDRLCRPPSMDRAGGGRHGRSGQIYGLLARLRAGAAGAREAHKRLTRELEAEHGPDGLLDVRGQNTNVSVAPVARRLRQQTTWADEIQLCCRRFASRDGSFAVILASDEEGLGRPGGAFAPRRRATPA
jgi:hypothetical protein